MGTSGHVTTGDLLLPEHLRLPDLTHTRTFTSADVRDWFERGQAAVMWGPDERNGCYRVDLFGAPTWVDDNHEPRCPDLWTPSAASTYTIEWDWDTRFTPAHCASRPNEIDRDGKTLLWQWRTAWHRDHAPAVLVADGEHEWWWQGTNCVDHPLGDLLDQAWLTENLTDEHARHLLDRAPVAAGSLGVPGRTWLAHVISAHPSPRLSPALRTWCALLTA